jgi:hypothetical protein
MKTPCLLASACARPQSNETPLGDILLSTTSLVEETDADTDADADIRPPASTSLPG